MFLNWQIRYYDYVAKRSIKLLGSFFNFLWSSSSCVKAKGSNKTYRKHKYSESHSYAFKQMPKASSKPWSFTNPMWHSILFLCLHWSAIVPLLYSHLLYCSLMVGLLHALAFMVLLLIGRVIWNNKPLPLPLSACLLNHVRYSETNYRVFHNCWNKDIGHKSRISNDTTMMITFIERWKDNI